MHVISLLAPTRGRKSSLERFVTSVVALADSPEALEIILYIDDDDEESASIKFEFIKCIKIIGPRNTMGFYNTSCYRKSSGEIIILVNDDIVVRTQGWDTRIRKMHEGFPDKIYLSYPNDLNKGRALSAFPILSRLVCEVLCNPFPIEYKGSFIDTHLFDIFERMRFLKKDRIAYLSDVVFEHMHFSLNKSTFDATYKDRGRFDDDEIFFSYREVRKSTANHLINLANGINQLPLKLSEPSPIESPSNILKALHFYSTLFLMDELYPLKNRIYNFLCYLARWTFKYYTKDNLNKAR